jgi:hypothetical protein
MSPLTDRLADIRYSKFCAALIALSITGSDFMEKKRVKLWCAGSTRFISRGRRAQIA